MSLGLGGQNWKTVPPLASGHLIERSAPRGTGSPRSIFGRGCRNPEARVGRQQRETDKTQEREREESSVKAVEAGLIRLLQAYKQRVSGHRQEEVGGRDCPFLPTPAGMHYSADSRLLQACWCEDLDAPPLGVHCLMASWPIRHLHWETPPHQ